MSIERITKQFPQCLERFNRSDYAAEFKRIKGIVAEVFEAPVPDAADEFFGFADGVLRRKLGRASRLFDLRTFLCVYVCPAAVSVGTDGAADFAAKVNARWNARYPECRFDIGSFEDIASGFRTKPFGF